MPVPNTFANATTSIPLSQLDQNFATAITLGNTAIQLGNTVTTLNNMTLANVTVSSGNVTVTSLSGAFNGTVGATTPNTGAFTTLSANSTSTVAGVFTRGTSGGDVITFTGSSVAAKTGYFYSDSNVVGFCAAANGTQATLALGATSATLYGPGQTASAAVSATGLAVTGTLSSTDTITSSASTTDLVGLSVINTNNSVGTITSSAIRLGITNSAGASYVRLMAQEASADDYPVLRVGVQNAVTTTPTTVATFSSTGLAVTGTVSSTGSITTTGGQIYVRGTGSSQNYEYEIGNDDTFVQQYASRNSGVSKGYKWYTSNTGASLRMTLDSTGNLGIGTSSPSYKLQITGADNSVSTFNDGIRVTSANGTVWKQYTWTGIDANDNMLFAINGSEKCRIDASGNLLVGTTNPGTIGASSGFAAYSDGSISASSTSNRSIFARRSTDGSVIEFRRDSTAVGSISVTTTATAYNTSSDYRLKENIQPMTGALARVMALKPCVYQWKANGEAGEGFIAHELSEVCPQAVSGEKDAVRVQSVEISPAIPATYDEDGNELTPAVEAVYEDREVPAYQGIDTSFLVATLTAAIQELNAKVAALEAKNAQV